MKRTQRLLVFAVIFGTAGILPASLMAEEFYLTRLRAGEQALQAKRTLEAVDQLRIACFGLLDQPQLLSEGLAVLALAQTAAGRTADVDATLARFVEVEQRFRVWAKVPLPPEMRGEVEALLAKRVRHEALLVVPSLANLVETDEQRIAKLPPKEKAKALEAKAKAEPRNLQWPLDLARDAAARGDHKAVIAWSGYVLQIDEKHAEALALRAHARTLRREYAGALAELKALPPERFAADPALHADLFVCLAQTKDFEEARAALAKVPEELRSRPDVAVASRRLPAEKGEERQAAETAPAPEPRPSPPETPEKRLAEARELMKGGKAAEAKGLLVPLAKSDPKNRETGKALLEAAVLTKDWELCKIQAASLQPFADGEEPHMFYAAVGLYETGNLEGARALIRRARPLISSNPFVDHYSKKILGK